MNFNFFGNQPCYKNTNIHGEKLKVEDQFQDCSVPSSNATLVGERNGI